MSCHVKSSSASRVFLAHKCNIISSTRDLWGASPCCYASAWEVVLAWAGCHNPGAELGHPSRLYSHSLGTNALVLSTGTACAKGKGLMHASREDSENYRPVSLASVLGKVMEQIILSAITWHVQDNQMIRPS